MKEPHIEGVANHNGPESCTYIGNGASEALTGVYAGEVLSREIMTLGCRRDSGLGRQYGGARYRKCSIGPTRSETFACVGHSVRENREIPRTARCEWWTSGRLGKAIAKAGDVRAREVGQRHSTDEVAERIIRSHVDWMPWCTLNGHEGGNAGNSQGRGLKHASE